MTATMSHTPDTLEDHAPVLDPPKTDRRPRAARLRRTLTKLVLTLATLTVLCTCAAPADAATVVGGHTFYTSTAHCAPYQLSIYVTGNTNDYSNGRYVRVVMYDYTARQWVYGGWHGLGSWGLPLTHEFNFSHHGYYYPNLEYAVWTSNGWAYGWERFATFGQSNAYGTTYTSSTCSL